MRPSRCRLVGMVKTIQHHVKSVSEKPTDFQALHEMIRRIRESVPASAWDNVPSDGARNKKHYLYGHPKEDEE